MQEALVDFTQSLPLWLQWAGVMLAAAIPFIESYFGTLIGVIAGVPLPITLLAAILGNVISMPLIGSIRMLGGTTALLSGATVQPLSCSARSSAAARRATARARRPAQPHPAQQPDRRSPTARW